MLGWLLLWCGSVVVVMRRVRLPVCRVRLPGSLSLVGGVGCSDGVVGLEYPSRRGSGVIEVGLVGG